ncbi:MAG: hypothetical protein WBX37_18665, partial [Pseudolabrys sp.]
NSLLPRAFFQYRSPNGQTSYRLHLALEAATMSALGHWRIPPLRAQNAFIAALERASYAVMSPQYRNVMSILA